MIQRRMSQRQKTLRAFEAYLNILDTADWLRSELRWQLESFGLTESGFRVLYLLYDQGAMSMSTAAHYYGYTRQNMDVVVRRLEKRELVEREVIRMRPKRRNEKRLPVAWRTLKRGGRRVSIVSLTPKGERLIEGLLPEHSKLVKSFLRTLDGREQESIIRICEKLRNTDVVRFVRELVRVRPGDFWEEDANPA